MVGILTDHCNVRYLTLRWDNCIPDYYRLGENEEERHRDDRLFGLVGDINTNVLLTLVLGSISNSISCYCHFGFGYFNSSQKYLMYNGTSGFDSWYFGGFVDQIRHLGIEYFEDS